MRSRSLPAISGLLSTATASLFVYKDNGYSGGDWKRPDWNQSVNDAKRNLWRILWTWNQDRLARDTEQFLWYYRQLDNAKARIFENTSNDFIDMSTLGGRVKHTQLAAAAEIFRMVTSEKVKKAYERNKKQGKPWGRRKSVWNISHGRELRAARQRLASNRQRSRRQLPNRQKRTTRTTMKRYFVWN